MAAHRVTTLALVFSCVFVYHARPVMAQEEPVRPVSREIELGVSVAGILWEQSQQFAPGLRLTIGSRHPRFAFEAGFDSLDFGPRDSHTALSWLYFVQAKHTLSPNRPSKSAVFATYGVAGLFEQTKTVQFTSPEGRIVHVEQASTSVSPPFLGIVGLGVQRGFAKHFGIRAEAQLLVALVGEDITPFTGRLSAGVVVQLRARQQ